MKSEIDWIFQKVKQNVNKIENRSEKVRNLENQSNQSLAENSDSIEKQKKQGSIKLFLE